jgi:hypothetical protein
VTTAELGEPVPRKLASMATLSFENDIRLIFIPDSLSFHLNIQIINPERKLTVLAYVERLIEVSVLLNRESVKLERVEDALT